MNEVFKLEIHNRVTNEFIELDDVVFTDAEVALNQAEIELESILYQDEVDLFILESGHSPYVSYDEYDVYITPLEVRSEAS